MGRCLTSSRKFGLNLYRKVMCYCVLNTVYWFNNTPGLRLVTRVNVIPVQGMTAKLKVKVRLHLFLNSALQRISSHFHAPGKVPWYVLNKMLGGSYSRPGSFGEQNNSLLLSGSETRFLGSHRFSPVVIPTEEVIIVT